MNRTRTILIAAAVVLGQSLAAAAAEKPNIVYILADDLGYGDLRCLNPGSKIATPNIDRLATEGTLFTDAHTGSSVCTPTRYGILTGRYCWRSRLKSGVLGGYSPPLIEPGRLTVPALLKQNGYDTACIGKWHLGWSWATKAPRPPGARGNVTETEVDFTRPIERGPCTVGFDRFFGISASLDMPPYVFVENDRVTVQPTGRQEAIKDQYVRVGPKDPSLRFDDVLPELTRRAVGYLGERGDEKTQRRPFFLYLALTAPHTPVAPAAAFHGKAQAGDYGDFVAQVDATVGQVLDALDRHGLAGGTLVILTSDNGPERTAYPRVEQYRHYSMGALRGVKRDLWEGGHRVPFFARWPGKVKAGRTCDETICHTDLMATAAALIGAELPANAGEDSANILGALLDETGGRPVREATVHHSASGRFAIRRGSLVLIDTPTGDDNREPDWFKTERGYKPHSLPGELYDLASDRAEHHNLYAERPDEVKQLKALLETYKREGRSTRRDSR